MASAFAENGSTAIMAILNVTPDSFSGDGLLTDGSATAVAESVAMLARAAVAEGAHLLDIGGMSSRPGAELLAEAEEMARVLPAVRAAAGVVSVPVSIDTFRASVAAAATAAGATVINSIWGLREPSGGWNHSLARVARETRAFLVLSHNRHAVPKKGTYGWHYDGTKPDRDIVAVVCKDLQEQKEYALSSGILSEHLIVDPCLGFGKTPDENMEILRRLEELKAVELPLMVGASRKSFIGRALGNAPPEERDYGTAAVTSWCIPRGADIVRVHNVRVNADAARMTDCLCQNLRIGSE